MILSLFIFVINFNCCSHIIRLFSIYFWYSYDIYLPPFLWIMCEQLTTFPLQLSKKKECLFCVEMKKYENDIFFPSVAKVFFFDIVRTWLSSFFNMLLRKRSGGYWFSYKFRYQDYVVNLFICSWRGVYIFCNYRCFFKINFGVVYCKMYHKWNTSIFLVGV